MPVVIGVTTAWSIETWGEEADKPGGIFYNPVYYTNVLYENGALPFLIAAPVQMKNDEDLQAIAESTLDSVDALFMSGGGGNRRFKAPDMPGLKEQQPVRYHYEALLLKEAWKRRMPVIGACRGHQMMIETLGGSIKKETVNGHQFDDYSKTAHPVQITPGSRLASLVQTENWPVNSMHCQVAETVPDYLKVVARSPEGYIEAIEADDSVFWIGFQFHPEIMSAFDTRAKAIIKALVWEAEMYSKRN